jgi:casein kinase 1
MQGTKGIPIVYWVGTEGEFNIIVMEMLGPNLNDLFQAVGSRFSLKTTALLGI